MDLTSLDTIRYIKSKYGFHTSKALGQNFLLDSDVLVKIAISAELTDTSGALEIGPGIGVLTNELAKHAKKVVAIELDKRLKEILDETLCEHSNIEIVFSDILKTNLKELIKIRFSECDKVSIAANLPYYITTPILTGLLEDDLIEIENIVVMVQKEVAQRICAAPGSKNCSALSALVHYHSIPEMICTVGANSFSPPPKVDSAVVKLKILKTPSVQPISREMFFKTIKAAFGQRRKTLLNALQGFGGFSISKDEFKIIFQKIGLSENIRGEQLTLEDFCRLSDSIVLY